MDNKLKQDHHKIKPEAHDAAAGPQDNGEQKATNNYRYGRGAQINTKNRFLTNEQTKEHIESIDDWEETNLPTQYLEQESKTIVNKVESKDVGMGYSMNPYAGCEHGCIYCYARNVHEYWGYSAGLDFEQKIIIKKNAPQLLRKFLMHPKWECAPIMLSGNTDCYQPAEQKYRLTRGLLEVCNEFNQPVGILTKNSWIIKDKDVLQDMAKKGIVSAMVSITSFNEDLRRIMEPRTTTARQKLKVIEELSKAGVRMGIMMGPMIPGLNEHEMQRIMKAAADNGATFTAYTFIRLNGAIKFLFHDWLYKNFPNHADKVWHLIEQSHDGKVNDTRWGVRMRGEGNIAAMVAQQYKKYGKLYNMNAEEWSLNTNIFKRPGAQGTLFKPLKLFKMNSITKEYLVEIIFKKTSETIDIHRQSKRHQFDNEPYPGATDEEVLDFIISMPYFDDKLKNFLLGNLAENTIIISQSWENEFIIKTRLWAESFEWLHGNDYFLSEAHVSSVNKERKFLSLPY